MSCHIALIDLGPAEMASVSLIFRNYGSTLGDAGSSHGEGSERGGDASAHWEYFNGGGTKGSRSAAMTGYYYTIRKSEFPKLMDWIIDGQHYKRVRNLSKAAGSLPILKMPTSLAAVEAFSKEWPDPLKVEYYPQALV